MSEIAGNKTASEKRLQHATSYGIICCRSTVSDGLNCFPFCAGRHLLRIRGPSGNELFFGLSRCSCGHPIPSLTSKSSVLEDHFFEASVAGSREELNRGDFGVKPQFTRSCRPSGQTARPTKPATSRLTEEGSGAATKVGEKHRLADPGTFCPRYWSCPLT